MKIFITGASGFVGGALAKSLSKNHTVTAMSRSERSDALITACGATPVRCTLGAVDPALLEGIDAVIHAAAKVEEFGKYKDFWAINVEGTKQLLDAAKHAAVARFIHIGTEASIFYGQHMRDINETEPLAFKSPYAYSRTKAYAEQAVLTANETKAGFTAISIRPRLVWGPGDKTVLPAVAEMVRAGKFMWLDGGHMLTSSTHIDNLVHGVTLALSKGTGGEAYFVTDDQNMPIRDFLSGLLATKNIVIPDKSAPGWIVGLLARACEATWHLFRLKGMPPLTRFPVDMTRRECTISINKAKDELGYRPVISVDQGMASLAGAERPSCGTTM
jgi:nucleoside-diphosphate-sugar epimerase